MKKVTAIALVIIGSLGVIAGVFWIAFCYMVSDPEIEGPSGRTPLIQYLFSIIPISFGILFLVLAHKINKKKISNF
jgi:hypothetical protein